MAEGILREKLKKRKIKAHVDSCGFERFHVGDPPDQRAQAVARKHGVELSELRARLFTRDDFDEFDLIYAMDTSHYNGIMRLARQDGDRAKVDYILNVVSPGLNLGVDDPWYHDQGAFERVFRQLDEACEVIANNLSLESF